MEMWSVQNSESEKEKKKIYPKNAWKAISCVEYGLYASSRDDERMCLFIPQKRGNKYFLTIFHVVPVPVIVPTQELDPVQCDYVE